MAKNGKNLSVSLLLDFYGAMLTEKQREVVALYYNEDLSLAEIAGIDGISRQGVRDSIKRAERQLYDCEEKLGLYSRFHNIQEQLDKISNLARDAKEENNKIASSGQLNMLLEKIAKIAGEINI